MHENKSPLPDHISSIDDISKIVQEPERLNVTRSNSIIKKHEDGDITADSVLQELSVKASALLHTPIALISLVDSQYDVLGGQVGLPTQYASTMQVDDQPSFCELTVAAGEPVVVNDALQVPTLRLFPSVANGGARAHLGIPLFVNNQPIGNCCVIDFEPREWSDADVAALKVLADEATQRLGELHPS